MNFPTFFFLRFYLRSIGAEVDRGFQPVGGGKSGVPVGRGLTYLEKGLVAYTLYRLRERKDNIHRCS